jgi:hypothetical protein
MRVRLIHNNAPAFCRGQGRPMSCMGSRRRCLLNCVVGALRCTDQRFSTDANQYEL